MQMMFPSLTLISHHVALGLVGFSIQGSGGPKASELLRNSKEHHSRIITSMSQKRGFQTQALALKTGKPTLASTGGQSHMELRARGVRMLEWTKTEVYISWSFTQLIIFPAQLAEDTTSTGLAPQQQGQGPHVVIGTLRKGGFR
jgi:hypothetical protein